MRFALEGSPRQAKFATIILTHVQRKQQLCNDLFKVDTIFPIGSVLLFNY
jgi:hypothetical protein